MRTLICKREKNLAKSPRNDQENRWPKLDVSIYRFTVCEIKTIFEIIALYDYNYVTREMRSLLCKSRVFSTQSGPKVVQNVWQRLAFEKLAATLRETSYIFTARLKKKPVLVGCLQKRDGQDDALFAHRDQSKLSKNIACLFRLATCTYYVFASRELYDKLSRK